MSASPDWLPHVSAIHWIFRHLNRWQSFLGSVLGLLGVAYSLQKNNSNSLRMEKNKREEDCNGIRTAFVSEVDTIVGQCKRWLDHLIPEAVKKGQKNIYPPAQFKTPIYDILKSSFVYLKDEEIKKLISFYGNINHMTRELIRIEFDEKDKTVKEVFRMNMTNNLEDDTFSICLDRKSFLERRLKSIRDEGEELHKMLNPQSEDIVVKKDVSAKCII